MSGFLKNNIQYSGYLEIWKLAILKRAGYYLLCNIRKLVFGIQNRVIFPVHLELTLPSRHFPPFLLTHQLCLHHLPPTHLHPSPACIRTRPTAALDMSRTQLQFRTYICVHLGWSDACTQIRLFSYQKVGGEVS